MKEIIFVKCPRCGKIIGLKRRGWIELTFGYLKSNKLSGKCKRCGYKIRKRKIKKGKYLKLVKW